MKVPRDCTEAIINLIPRTTCEAPRKTVLYVVAAEWPMESEGKSATDFMRYYMVDWVFRTSS